MHLTIGEILLDCYISIAENNLTNKNSRLDLSARVGGSPFNVAIGLRRLGLDTGFIGSISNDFFGNFLMDFIRSEGISKKYITRSNKSSSLVLIRETRDHSFEYQFNTENAADLSLDYNKVADISSDCLSIHFGSYSILKPPLSETIYKIVSDNYRDKLISFDINLRLNYESDIEDWLSAFSKFGPFSDIIKMSIEDYLSLFKCRREDVDISTAVGKLLCFTEAKLAVITLDNDGVIAATKKGVCVNQPSCTTKVYDTVGAGDSFMAALIYKVFKDEVQMKLSSLSNQELGDIINFASLASAITVSRKGADLPNLAEIKAWSKTQF